MKPPSNQTPNRRRSPRFKAQLRARLLFSVVLSEETSTTRHAGRLHLVGHTKDISEIGLALVLPIAEIDERYLTAENSKMQIELYLPGGPIKISARPIHYKSIDESLGETIFTEGYLIGAEITKVSDRDLLVEYLSSLEENG